ncbi:MAG: 30S ribosomal protein S20, partial [Candidatus Saccharimonadales bacterium]
MPIIKSAAKRVRQDAKRTRINNRYRRELRNQVKAVVDAVTRGDKKSAEAGLPLAQKAIDKAVKQGVIHKNTASRKKASLNKK